MGTATFGTRGRGHVTLAGALSALAALALFAYMVQQAGVGLLAQGVARIGLGGFALILALSGVRLFLRAVTWRLCLDERERLPLSEAYGAILMGEALGNAIPFAGFLTEPAKAALVRRRVPLSSSLPALVVENIVYSVTVGMVIVLGALAFFATVGPDAGGTQADRALEIATAGSVALVALVVAGAYLVLRTNLRPATRGLSWLRDRGVARSAIERQFQRVEQFEAKIGGFTTRHGDRLLPLVACEGLFQAAGVAEVYVTLALVVGSEAGLLAALILEGTGRVVNILFKFVPMRLGVDEAGAALVTRALGFGSAPGVTLGLVRKARVFAWTAVGMILLLRRGLSIGRALDEAEAAAARAAGDTP